MTYLQLVNSVLRRLREEEVSSVSQNSYSKLVGEFVNDAKRTVEDSYDWTALRTTLTVSTTSDTFNYVLTGSQNRMKLLDVINDTSDFFMQYRPSRWMDNAFLIETPPLGSPQFYSFNGVDANGDNAVDVYPKPSGVFSLRFDVCSREPNLTADADATVLPSMPIIHQAVALLARERGETGGTTTQDYFIIADKHLSDAIAQDAYKNPEEFIYTVQ